MNRYVLTGALAALLLGTGATAAELPLQPVEIDNLGIEFRAPEPVDAATTIPARARVIVPPDADYAVSAAVPGLVERVFVGVGDSVAAGQPLLAIRSPEFLSLQQQYLEARADAAVATAQLNRDRELFDEGIIAERRFEEASARAASAESRLAEHARLLDVAGLRREDIRRLGEGGELLESLVVRAPVDGAVLEFETRAGQSVASTDMLCRVADLSVLWLDIRVPQELIDAVLPGAEVAVRESRVERPARVLAIGQSVDPEMQTVPVRGEVIRAGHGLRPGQLVTVNILAVEADAAGTPAVSVPTAALMRSGDAAYVFVRSANGVIATPVTVVASAGQRVILRGVDAGASIAVTGVSALKALWLAAGEADG